MKMHFRIWPLRCYLLTVVEKLIECALAVHVALCCICNNLLNLSFLTYPEKKKLYFSAISGLLF